ncbi:phage portal protein [Rhodococcus sp. 1168]|uniref:phage portal protein n=1 Tax=Rhodococcus sp. 1168 TaxID=2018041 RepID=UPI000A0E7271|nr:phage portal protein [Rhodococcus sp. 1168]ORI25608.1 hypothetical protein BJI47_03060 [Rhodococcus sp. 1168]
MSDLTKAVSELLSKRDDYLLAESYYEGNTDEIHASSAVKRALRKSGDTFRVNFAKTPVTAVANRLEITGVTTLSASAKQLVDRTWQHNDLELELTKIISKTLIYGDSYVFVWPNDDEIEIYYNSPLSTIVLYDVENPRKPSYAAKLWPIELEDGKQRQRVNLYYADRIEKHISSSERLPFTIKPSDFEPFIDDDTDEYGMLPNEFDQIPIFHLSTGDQYGKPEHLSAYGPQDAITKLLITGMAAVESYGFPTRYVLQGEQSGISIDDEGTADELGVGAGEEWILRGVSSVGQFKAADPLPLIANYREYVRALASVTETPLHYFENTQTNVSGEALRASEAPLVKKVRMRQLSIGTTLRKLFIFVLKLNNIDEDVQLEWRGIESIDTSEQWSINKKKLEAGLPVEQILLEHGYDTELIAKWKAAGLLEGMVRQISNNDSVAVTKVQNTEIEGAIENE